MAVESHRKTILCCFIDKTNDVNLGTTIEMPLLPLRDVVVFPHMIVPLFVGEKNPLLPWSPP